MPVPVPIAAAAVPVKGVVLNWGAKRKQEEEESMKLARELEEEEKKQAEIRRLNKEEKNKANCDICLDEIADADLFPLDKCGHIYHSACMEKYLGTQVKDRKYPLKCPNEGCKAELTMADVSEFLEHEELEKYLEYSFKHEVEANPAEYSFCPTPNCKYVFVWKKGEDDNEFECPLCAQHYCLNCRCVYHTGLSCEQYRRSAGESVSRFPYPPAKRCHVHPVRRRNEAEAVPVLSLLGREDGGMSFKNRIME